MKITAEQIYKAAPYATPAIVGPLVAEWQSIAEAGGIVSPIDTAFFLGHAATETTGFTRLEENLYYTTASRLRGVWPSRFKSEAAAKPFLRNPRALANMVYGDRLGNRGNNTDDGWNYRGSGIFQTTGRDNFAEVGAVDDPDILRTMPAALVAAVHYWNSRKLSALTSRADAIEATTQAINGGDHGLASRRLYIGRFLTVFRSTITPSTIRRGHKGAMVGDLQTRLAALGFYAGKIDGDFGPGTERAVMDYQEARHLIPVDGVAGPLTLGALYRETNQ